MIKRHEATIRNNFDDLAATGKTEFSDRWLLSVFSATRMGKNKVWRALFEYLPEDIDTDDLWLFRNEGRTVILHHRHMTDVEEYLSSETDEAPES